MITRLSGRSLTLLFTDIEGSTRMLDRLGDRYGELLAEHHRVIRAAIEAAGGREVDTAGDSFFAVFERAHDAAACARLAQRGLRDGRWPDEVAPRVRMGIHTGTPVLRDGEFVGMDVHRAARVMGVSHGGQVLLSEPTRRALGSDVGVRDLGVHRLKDLPQPERLFQLLGDGLEREFAPTRSLNRSNLPVAPNRLVGRAAEVRAVLTLIGREETRLVTLLGPGGTGKTRLVLEVAAEAVGRYRDGVWLVLLASLGEPELLVSQIANALELELTAGQTLAAALGDRELLLVLDNFEHLIEAAGVVADLLAGSRSIDVLVTSREPLRIGVEQRMDVSPLAVDAAADLFLARARAMRPDLVLDDEDRAAIRRICERLDCLPLALELAAVRVATFSPRRLEARLSAVALPTGPRDLPERQRTLHATIDWSYRLLNVTEQTLLTDLAPFVGGIRLETAEEAWGPDAVDSLISLGEKNLLRRREDIDGEPRFWMLETIREYASGQAIVNGSATEAEHRHAHHYRRLAEQAAPHLLGPDQPMWLDHLEDELANLGAAFDLLTAQEPALALQMAVDLAPFWRVRGHVVEGRERLTLALAAAPADGAVRARALTEASILAMLVGATDEIERHAGQALQIIARDEEALQARARNCLAVALARRGDRESSLASYMEAVTSARGSGDDRALAFVLNSYAGFLLVGDDVPGARTMMEESLRLRRRVGAPDAIAVAAGNLALVAINDGALDRAHALVDEALESARKAGFSGMVQSAIATRGQIALIRGDAESALGDLRESIQLLRPSDETVGPTLSDVGVALAQQGNALTAATLWATADRLSTATGLAQHPADRDLRAHWQAHAQGVSDSDVWAAAIAVGARQTIEQAIALATAALAEGTS